MAELGKSVVSVIIPTFNRAHTLPRAIRSVFDQTYQDWELIVVDDGSEDDTVCVVRGFGDPRVRCIRHEQNHGQAAARNTGIKAALGTYIAFLDSDDEWLPEKLAKEVALFEASGQGVGLVYVGKMIWDANGRMLSIRMPTLQGDVYEKLLAWDFIGSCSRVTLRKNILESVGGFDEKLALHDDWDLWLRVAKVSRVGFVPECLVKRHFGSAQVSGSLWRIYEAKAKVVEKHRGDMDRSVLGKHLGNLAIILFNYDEAHAWRMALEAMRLRPFQPLLFAALGASLLGGTVYRWMFSKLSRLRHGLYVGRAAT